MTNGGLPPGGESGLARRWQPFLNGQFLGHQARSTSARNQGNTVGLKGAPYQALALMWPSSHGKARLVFVVLLIFEKGIKKKGNKKGPQGGPKWLLGGCIWFYGWVGLI